MKQSNAQGGESLNKQDAFELRHPTPELFNDEMARLRQQQLGRLTLGYEQAQANMDAFFADGHPRPEHGDESY